MLNEVTTQIRSIEKNYKRMGQIFLYTGSFCLVLAACLFIDLIRN